MFSTSGDIQCIGGVHYIRWCSLHQGVLSTLGEYHEYIGGVKYIGGYHECIGEGGYHEYIGGCSVHWGISRCMWGDTMSTLGDVSTSGDIMSTLGFSIEIERIYQVTPPNAS